MHVVFHARRQRLAVLEKNALALWDLTSGAPVLRASTALLSGDNANGCEAWVGVLAGKVAPAGGSLRAATLHRFDWDLTALPSPVLSEIARHTLSNESWGGRGVCMYDMYRRAPLWSVTLPGTDEEPESWFAFQAEFASLDRILLLAGPRALRAFAVEDGRDLGSVPLPGDGRQGFALDEAFWRVWVPGLAVGAAPVAVALPDAWREVFAVADPPKRRTRKKKS